MGQMKFNVSKYQMKNNLRRTAKLGLISLLNKNELEQLALKYYGEFDKNGDLIGYQCPYSGDIIKNNKKIVLEHIIPVSSGGGTVLFNCIPTSEKVNMISEKGANHLLTWWKSKKYYTPEKLDRLLSYIFEAYDIVFKNYTIEEIENSYEDIDFDEENKYDADNKTTSKEVSQILKRQAEKTGIISYLGFINDCINELKEKKYDTSKYEIKLNEFISKGIFKKVDRYTLCQNIIKETIKNKLNIENRSELTYTLNINISKLMNSMNEYQTYEDIKTEILKRINNIELIMKEKKLGLQSFFDNISKQTILYRRINEITETDINQFYNELVWSVNDKFNQLCTYVEDNNGLLPSTTSKNDEIRKLGFFRNSMKSIQKNYQNNKNYLVVDLTREQLQYLHDSPYESLRNVYKEILYKAINNNIEIKYVDEEMKKRIMDFNRKMKYSLNLEDKINLEQEYKDVIIVKSQFNEFINFVITNNGCLPSKYVHSDLESTLTGYKRAIITIKNKLNREQLQYLHNSPYESLRNIYKEILYKAINNNIEIEYVDEKMKKRIIEFDEKKKAISKFDEEFKLEQEYKDVIVIKSLFNEFVNFVIVHDGKLPSQHSKNNEEKILGGYRDRIQNKSTNSKNYFGIILTKKQLQYLHDSPYKNLKKIYKVILNKSIENNIEIEYVDEEMKKQIIEFKEKKKMISTIDEEIELEQKYKNVIIPNKFNEFINFIIENNGNIPKLSEATEEEKTLILLKASYLSVRKHNFGNNLNKEQLQYLHNSPYESLRKIYTEILIKSLENNIEIEYVDEEMKKQIIEFKEKKKMISTIDEEIELEQKYRDVILTTSKFNELIHFVIAHNGKLPIKNGESKKEKQLANYVIDIQNISNYKNSNNFSAILQKKHLCHLKNSPYEELRNIYKIILNKSLENNVEIEYVDEEMKKQIIEFKEKKKTILTIDEEIELEQKYRDVIVTKGQFNNLVTFVIQRNGELLNKNETTEVGQKLRRYLNSIKTFNTKSNKFASLLTKLQLNYLYNSSYDAFREIYDIIMKKAYSVNYQEYIDIDVEIRNEEKKGVRK